MTSTKGKNQAAWAKGKHRRENGRETAPHPPTVAATWSKISGRDLDLVRMDLGLTEAEMAAVLGTNLSGYRGLRSGPGTIIGATVKLVALLRSFPKEQRQAVIAFLMSPEAPTLPPA